jgi:MerR family transcriptional regulator, redox-sensitive transcriptional activator SoxR
VTELLTIGEVATRVGLRTSALRYYEETGLIEPAVRVGGQRRYDPSVLEILTVIRFCQSLGFTLAEARELLRVPRGKAQKERWRELVDAKVRELDDASKRIRAMRRVLGASRDCDCVDLEQCAAVCSSV